LLLCACAGQQALRAPVRCATNCACNPVLNECAKLAAEGTDVALDFGTSPALIE